jgi:hypothetical protein
MLRGVPMKPILILSIFFLSQITQATIKYGTDSIYNIDNRELVTFGSTSTSFEVQDLAKSVALIFNSDDLITEHGQLLIFANQLLDLPPVGLNICPDERFADHQAYKNACSGFLIGKDLLATAGHCFESKFDCENKLIAFDVDADSEILRGFKADNDNIFKCKKIVAHIHQTGNKQDFAVIKLDRKTKRAPLKLRTKGKIMSQDLVFLIGHPLGLPLIFSPSAEIIENSNPLFFTARINSFHGNSGSPIFNNRTLQVEGILVRGQEDFQFDDNEKCQRYKKYSSLDPNDKLKGEDVTRIKYILPFTK